MAVLALLEQRLIALPDWIKHAIDGLSVVATLATLVQWLPAIASLASVVWTAIRIYETRTVQQLLGRDVAGAPDND
jgi:hypothetical protein